KRPFHADEATGARITSARMESGDYQFDPFHYHGPTLSSLAGPLCQMSGQNRWSEMSKTPPRVLTAIAGTLLILVPLLWRGRFGDGPMLLTAALFATSPLLVYYSRMFIHESLLVLCGMVALVSLTKAPRYGIPGVFIGLMFATKESFAITMLAWMGAAVLVALENRKQLDRTWWIAAWRDYRIPVAASVLTAALISGFFYTDGFRQPTGAIDAVRTFFVYETVAGHDKPLGWYLSLLAVPLKSGGVWWFGTPVVILALLGFISSFRRREGRLTIRFIAYAAVGHFAIYSLIAYKTPWLACLPWAHVCLLAGFSISGFSHHRVWVKITLYLLVVATLGSQFHQARKATGRFASDDRNPFAYVPTRSDMENLEPWLVRLREVAPGGTLEPIGVIGTDYWPLPWYLRTFKKIGYWPTPSGDFTLLPLVFAMPEVEEAVASQLQQTHTPLPRGLRAGVPVVLFVRNDIWNSWNEAGK
ncbi:MAG: flippase activity-associated protein Agl23, partial [Luteolibacter sp.]